MEFRFDNVLDTVVALIGGLIFLYFASFHPSLLWLGILLAMVPPLLAFSFTIKKLRDQTRKIMIICPHCGAKNYADARYCEKCGTILISV